jgi:thioredoxin
MTAESNITNMLVDSLDPSLDKFLSTTKIPLVVKFTAEWCGPCKQLQPLLEKVAAKFKGRVLVIQIDIDRSPKCAEHYGVQAVPQMLFFACGKLVKTRVGVLPESKLTAEFESLLTHSCANPDAQEEYTAALRAAEERRDARINAAQEALLTPDETGGEAADSPEAKAFAEAGKPLNEAVDAELKDAKAKFEAGELDASQYLDMRLEVSKRLMADPKFAEVAAKLTAATETMMQAALESPAVKAMEAEVAAAEAEYDAAVAAAEAKLAASASSP